MPPFEAIAISTVDTNARKGFTYKTGEEFAADIAAAYERVRSAGGKVISHEMVDLTHKNVTKVIPHAVIVADIPEQTPQPGAEPSSHELWEGDLPGSTGQVADEPRQIWE